jgi:hypothetical protein
MDEHEMHLPLHIARSRRGACSVEGIQKTIMSDSWCAAVKASLSRAVPGGTVGGLIDVAQASLAEAAAHGNSSFRRSQDDGHDLGGRRAGVEPDGTCAGAKPSARFAT